MSNPRGSDFEALLEHAGWLRALARSLVADPNAADDLVQKTWLAALEHPPGETRPLKHWFAAVLRNFAREDRRSRVHRAQREQRAAHPEATPSTHHAVASAMLQQALIDAVLALEAPYRDAIIWRYFESLPPREIAKRQHVSVNTVKTRLGRGIERLRTELDRRHQGDRKAWLSALIPLVAWPAPPASILGTLLVNAKLKTAIVASLVLASVAGVWALARTNAAAGGPPSAATMPELVAEPAVQLAEPGAGPSLRETADELPARTPESHRPTPAAGASPVLVRGRVIDVDSRAVAGVAVVSGAQTIASSGADGSFEAPGSSIRGTLRTQSTQYTTVLGVDAWANFPQSGLLLVVAPRILVAGVVVDEAGEPVPGAEVHVRPDRAFLQELGLITDQSFELRFVTAADDRGRFEVSDAPGMSNAVMTFSAPGFESSSVPAPVHPTHDLRLILSKNGSTVILGEVLDPRNKPVPGAWVEAGQETTRTDVQGRFVLEPGESVMVENGAAEQLAIVVVKEGFLPARLPKPDGGWPGQVTIHLEGSPLAIRGRVVDSGDRPVAGAEIWTLDEHRFANVPDEESNAAMPKTIETILRGPAPTITSEDGSFELGGLLPGSYRIACSHKKTLRAVATEPLPAGRDGVTIRVPDASRCVPVAGRVLSRSHAPVAGVYVFPCRVLVPGDGHQFPPPSAHGEGRITDAEGRFACGLLCPDELYFQVDGQNLDIVGKWDPPPGARLDELEIVVPLRCHVQVDLGDRAHLADAFQVLDEKGEALTLVRWEGPLASMGATRPIASGRSDIVSVSDAASILILSKGTEEVQRIPVQLVPGEVTVIRP